MIKDVVDADFPENFPSLLPHLKQLLHTQDFNSIYTALFVLRIVAKKYECVLPSALQRSPLLTRRPGTRRWARAGSPSSPLWPRPSLASLSSSAGWC